MCAVTDKVWTIKGVREGGTPFTTLAPLQISNETFLLAHISTPSDVCGALLMVLGRLSSTGGGGVHGHPHEWALILGCNLTKDHFYCNTCSDQLASSVKPLTMSSNLSLFGFRLESVNKCLNTWWAEVPLEKFFRNLKMCCN